MPREHVENGRVELRLKPEDACPRETLRAFSASTR